MTIPDATWEFRVGASRSASSAVDNLPWHGFGKIRGDERDIDDGKYGMDEGQGPHPEAVWTQTVRTMIMNELTKSEKRKCRELIQLGLNRECAKFVEQIRNLSQTTSEDPHAQYIAIYRKTRTFDKHVAWRYDDMRGSKYLPTVASLLADKVIREDEIVGFSDENREHILRSASIRQA